MGDDRNEVDLEAKNDSGTGKKQNDMKKDSEQKNIFQAKNKLGEYTAEFKKIIWPSRKELYKKTFTVIATSLLFGVVIFGMDTIYMLGMRYFVILIGK